MLAKTRQAIGHLEGTAGGAASGVWRTLRELLLSNLDAIAGFAVTEQLGHALGIPAVVDIILPIAHQVEDSRERQISGRASSPRRPSTAPAVAGAPHLRLDRDPRAAVHLVVGVDGAPMGGGAPGVGAPARGAGRTGNGMLTSHAKPLWKSRPGGTAQSSVGTGVLEREPPTLGVSGRR